jgi:hypothetical protein
MSAIRVRAGKIAEWYRVPEPGDPPAGEPAEPGQLV